MEDSPRRRPRILLGVTGSVAAVKAPELACKLAWDLNSDVCVLLTRGGENFWNKASEYDAKSWKDFSALIVKDSESDSESGISTEEGGSIIMHSADDEWKGWHRLGDPVLHIDLRDWADLAIVAPLSAHTLAKISTGLCDDTLSCIIRAWDFGNGTRGGKPLILAPAMNTAMWEHPLTKSQLDTIKGFWNVEREINRIVVVEPQVKKLACGEIGTGALAALPNILRVAKDCIQSLQPLQQQGRSCPQAISSERKDRIRSALVSFARKQFHEQVSKVQIGNGCGDGSRSVTLVAPVSPTPDELIDLVMPRLGLTADSLLLDLGCGDGRWIVSASLISGCKCIGCDMDEERLNIAKKELCRLKLSERVELTRSDVFKIAQSSVMDDVDVVVMYLFREAMTKMSHILRERCRNSNMKKSVVIVSVGFSLPSFVPLWKSECGGIRVYMYKLERGTA